MTQEENDEAQWWQLEPAHELVRNQTDDVTRRMALAKAAAGNRGGRGQGLVAALRGDPAPRAPAAAPADG